MWSFQMIPFNYWYVIFMWAKCLHRENVWQTKFPYKLVDRCHNSWLHTVPMPTVWTKLDKKVFSIDWVELGFPPLCHPHQCKLWGELVIKLAVARNLREHSPDMKNQLTWYRGHWCLQVTQQWQSQGTFLNMVAKGQMAILCLFGLKRQTLSVGLHL